MLTGTETNNLIEILLQIRIFKFQSKKYGAIYVLSVVYSVSYGEVWSSPPGGDISISHSLCDAQWRWDPEIGLAPGFHWIKVFDVAPVPAVVDPEV